MAALLIFTVVVAALASALETTLLCLREHRIISLTGKGSPLREKILAIARRPRRSLNQVLILSTTANLSLAVLGLFFLRESGLAIAGRPVLTATLLFAGLILIVDILPKMIALTHPSLVLRFTVTPFLFIGGLIHPMSEGLFRLTEWIGRWLYTKPAPNTMGLSEEEVETLIDMKRDEGVLLPVESEMIQDIIKLGKKTAKDCMTPRVDALMLSIDSEDSKMRKNVRRCGHWQVPVYKKTPDIITGILDCRNWLQHPDSPIQDFIRPPVFVPETMMALEVMRRHLHQSSDLVIVVDEYGGVEGVLSHADMIEEIIGEAAPLPEQEPDIQDLGNGQLLISGSARLDDIGERFDLDLEMEMDGPDTIGGMIFNQIGGLPAPGRQINLKNTSIVVRKCQGNRITEVIAWKRGASGGGTAASPPMSND